MDQFHNDVLREERYVANVYNEGFNARLQGKYATNPYTFMTSQYNQWQAGFNDADRQEKASDKVFNIFGGN